MKVEPENIYFGSLKPGTGGNATLKVTGGPVDVVTHNDHLKVIPSNVGADGAQIQVELLPGSAGELIWDDITLKSEFSEIAVVVTAWWEGFPVPEATVSKPTVVVPTVEAGQPPALTETPEYLSKPRPWVGKRCARCHKNFAYNSNNHDWEQCKCNWYQIAVNMSIRIMNELRYGIKDFPAFAKETWNVILGKEKW